MSSSSRGYWASEKKGLGNKKGGSSLSSIPNLSGAAPGSTAALIGCTEAWCVAGWGAAAYGQYLLGLGEVAVDLVWTSCTPCQLGQYLVNDIIPMLSDSDAYWAGQQAEAAAQAEFWTGDPLGEIGNSLWTSLINNPGHLLGTATGTVGTFAIPGAGILKGASAASKAARVGDTVGEEAGSLFRGVPFGHEGYDDALKGVAAPWGTHTDAARHNGGRTDSVFTSWTTDRGIASEIAGAGNGPGIILRIANADTADYFRVASPDVYGESEVLVRGVVTGAEVMFK